ncbi:MAG: rhodanese-like domain-containing protein [Spirochaetales bacterium]|nr:rhodanese-like domain-containing protein [Spirochaetales bacterium]
MKLGFTIMFLFGALSLSSCFGMGGQELPKGLTHVSTEEFSGLLEKAEKNENYVVLDVRTQGEYDAGHLPGAVLLDFYQPDFKEELDKLDKDKSYLVYCRSGNRSGQTLYMMADLKFSSAVNMMGGMIRWVAEKREIVK